MRTHLLSLLVLVAACSSGEGLDRKTTPAVPDAGAGGGKVSATSPGTTPDAGPLSDALVPVDTRPADTLTSAPDTSPALQPDVSLPPDTVPAVVPDAGVLPDTMSQPQPDALVPTLDTARPDRYVQPDTYRAPDTIPPDTAPLKFESCKYLDFLVSKMTAGMLCGHYPSPGPNGTIYCFTGCTVTSLFDVSTVPPNVAADSNAAGYCGAPTDESKAMPGGDRYGTGLCFESAETCAKVCLPQ